MVGRNNFLNKMQSNMERKPHYGIRKLGVGVASVLLSTTLYLGTVSSNHVLADTQEANTDSADTSLSKQALAELKAGTSKSEGSQQSLESEKTLKDAINERDQAVNDAQKAGVTVTKRPPVYIDGKTVQDAEKKATQQGVSGNYADQTSALKNATEKQIDAKSQNDDDYNTKLKAYKQKLKDNKLPNVDAKDALTGNDINQKFVIGDESNVVISAKIATDNDEDDLSDLAIVEGNDNNYSKAERTFEPQGPFHEVQFLDKNKQPVRSHAIKGHFADITFSNLQNSYYDGKRIAEINMALSDLERDERIDDTHYENHGVVVYDDIVRGLQYAGTSVTVTYTFYDAKGNRIIFDADKANAWFAPFSLNNHNATANRGYLEGAHILAGGEHKQLMGSAITIHPDGEYANSNTPSTISDGKNKQQKWDLTVKQDDDGLRTYGSGLYQATGNEIKLQFFMKLNDPSEHQFEYNGKGKKLAWTHGSIWSGIDTSIPSYNIDNTPAPIAKNATVQAYYYDNIMRVPSSVTYHVADNAKKACKVYDIADGQNDKLKSFENNGSGWQDQNATVRTIPAGYSIYTDKEYKNKVKANNKGEILVTAYHPNIDLYIVADPQKIDYKVIDDTTNTTLTENPIELATGVSNGEVPSEANDKLQQGIQDYLDQGYVLVSKVEVPTKFDTDDTDNQTIEVHLKHGTIPVTPDTPSEKKNGIDSDKLVKTVTETVHYIAEGAKNVPADKSFNLKFNGTAYYDTVTKKWTDAKGKELTDQNNPVQIWTPATETSFLGVN